MSAGRFVDVLYESDTADVHFLTVQPETVEATINGATNAAATGPATSDFWFQRSRGATEYGGRPRFIRIRWNIGGAPANYQETASLLIPVLTTAVFNAASIGDAVTYLGGAATISRKLQQNIFPGI